MADKLQEYKEFKLDIVDNTNIAFVKSHVQLYNEITNSVLNSIDSINQKFYQIGLLLFLSKVTKNYCIDGFKDIYEYAEEKFKLKKTSTKNLIKIVEKFSSERLFNDLESKKIDSILNSINYSTRYLNNDYLAYKYSQLIEMTKLSNEEIEEINPDMSIREIKQIIADKKINEFIDSEEKKYLNLFNQLKDIILINLNNAIYKGEFKKNYHSSFQKSFNFNYVIDKVDPKVTIYFKLRYFRTLVLDGRYPQVELILTDSTFSLDSKILMQVSINDDKIISYLEHVINSTLKDYILNIILKFKKQKESILIKENNSVSINEKEQELMSYDEYTCEFDEYFILKTFVENNNITKDDKIYNDKNNEFKSLINDNKLKFGFYYNDSDFFDITLNDKCYHIDKFKYFDWLAQKLKELNITYETYLEEKPDELIIYEKNK